MSVPPRRRMTFPECVCSLCSPMAHARSALPCCLGTFQEQQPRTPEIFVLRKLRVSQTFIGAFRATAPWVIKATRNISKFVTHNQTQNIYSTLSMCQSPLALHRELDTGLSEGRSQVYFYSKHDHSRFMMRWPISWFQRLGVLRVQSILRGSSSCCLTLFWASSSTNPLHVCQVNSVA